MYFQIVKYLFYILNSLYPLKHIFLRLYCDACIDSSDGLKLIIYTWNIILSFSIL